MKTEKYVAEVYYGDPREELDYWFVAEAPKNNVYGPIIKKFYHDDKWSETAAKELAAKLNADDAC